MSSQSERVMRSNSLKLFGACLSCPAVEADSSDRPAECLLRQLIAESTPDVLENVKGLNEVETDTLWFGCKRCFKSQVLHLKIRRVQG